MVRIAKRYATRPYFAPYVYLVTVTNEGIHCGHEIQKCLACGKGATRQCATRWRYALKLLYYCHTTKG